MNKGFTLIELVVAVGIMGVIGFIATDILIQTLRGQNKVRILNVLKQNGQVAMDKMSNDIRASENKIFCIGSFNGNNGNTIVIFKSGTYIRYRFYPPSPVSDPTSNGYIASDSWSYPSDPATVCSSEAQISSNLNIITDRDSISGVSIDYTGVNPFFQLVSLVGFNDAVTIKFTTKPGVGVSSNYDETVVNGVDLATTVQIRGGKR